jgi:hypothetical protein
MFELKCEDPCVKKRAQLDMLAKNSLAYGGDLLKRRKGRTGARPLATSSGQGLLCLQFHPGNSNIIRMFMISTAFHFEI